METKKALLNSADESFRSQRPLGVPRTATGRLKVGMSSPLRANIPFLLSVPGMSRYGGKAESGRRAASICRWLSCVIGRAKPTDPKLSRVIQRTDNGY